MKTFFKHFSAVPVVTTVATNGQAEVANREILKGLKRRLGEAKGNWVEELDLVLWAYRTTPHSSTSETPFCLVYGTDVVIPVEIDEPSFRTENFSLDNNNSNKLQELYLLNERRAIAHLRAEALRQRAALKYNKRIVSKKFEVGDLVLCRAGIGAKQPNTVGKLSPNWEGPYRVIDKTGKEAYKLETLDHKPVKNKWNVMILKTYFS